MIKDLRLDSIRAFAICLVVFVHTMGQINEMPASLYSQAIKGFYSIIYAGVPLFTMLSGALLLGKDEPLKHFISKRFHKVLIPFFIWSIIVSLIHFFQNGGRNIFAWTLIFIKDFFGNGVHGIYWYIYMILGLYLITPALRIIAKNKKQLHYSAIICFALYYVKQIHPNFSFVNRFYCENLIYIGYYLTGYALYTYNFKNISKKIIISSFLLLYTLMIILSLLQISFSLIPFIAISLFSFFLFSNPSEKTNIFFAQTLSKYSYGIYLSHFILISFISKYAIIQAFPIFIAPIVLAISVIAIDLALLYTIDKCKLSSFFM